MPSTVSLIIQATVKGFVFGSSGVTGSSVSAQQYKTTFSSTYSGFNTRQTITQVSTSLASAANLVIGSSCIGMLLIPDSTFAGTYWITAGTTQAGIQLQGPSPAIVPTSVALLAYTTEGRSFSMQVIAV